MIEGLGYSLIVRSSAFVLIVSSAYHCITLRNNYDEEIGYLSPALSFEAITIS